MWSTIATRSATRTGWRYGRSTTPKPSRMRFVCRLSAPQMTSRQGEPRMTMPIFVWNGMISSAMHFTQAFCCPGRTTYCRNSKNIDASFRSSGYRGAPRLRRGTPSVGGVWGAISGPPLQNRPARAREGDAGARLQALADFLHGGKQSCLAAERLTVVVTADPAVAHTGGHP